MALTVYIETTIISYLTARPSRDLIVAGHQQLTTEWWDRVRPNVECCISPFVLQEAERGDPAAADRRLATSTDITILTLNEEIITLARTYTSALGLPPRSELDAFHLAVAAWHRVEYLLTWNCTHIASGRTRRLLDGINTKLGVHTPVICTPEELMEV
jgi:hypothetical protein